MTSTRGRYHGRGCLNAYDHSHFELLRRAGFRDEGTVLEFRICLACVGNYSLFIAYKFAESHSVVGSVSILSPDEKRLANNTVRVLSRG